MEKEIPLSLSTSMLGHTTYNTDTADIILIRESAHSFR